MLKRKWFTGFIWKNICKSLNETSFHSKHDLTIDNISQEIVGRTKNKKEKNMKYKK